MNKPIKQDVIEHVAEIQAPSEVQAPSPLMIISKAAESGANIDVMEKMFDLYERDQDRKSRTEFQVAMSRFQGMVPAIHKSKKADRYSYAPLEMVLKKIRQSLLECGLSVRFDTKQSADYLTAFCTVSHIGGYSETSEFGLPIDKENKTKLNVAQLQGSANSYARRYALANALNLVFTDEDDDGQAAAATYINEEQAANIQALLEEVGADKPLFLKWTKSNSIEEISESKYATCIKRLEELR